MKKIGRVKQGDTFGLLATLTDENGDALIGKTDDLKSQVRDISDELICDLTIRETDDGTYLLECLDTSEWPISLLYLDIQYTNEDVVTSTETMSISVEKDVTKNE